MDLLLVRHGLAGKADPAVWPDDDLRPLTPKGRKAFKAAARGLKKSLRKSLKRQSPRPTLILTSPALRTRETAAILAKVLGLRAGALKDWEPLHHAHSPVKALSLLPRQRLPRAAALVGHEPWLGEFLSLLLCGRTDAGLEMGKGGAAWVEIPEGAAAQLVLRPDGQALGKRVLGPKGEALGKGRGRLHWLLTQDQLAAME